MCHKCTPIPSVPNTSLSRSSKQLHNSTDNTQERTTNGHRQSLSLPEHTCECEQKNESHSECYHGQPSITNVYHVSCCCSNNRILTSAGANGSVSSLSLSTQRENEPLGLPNAQDSPHENATTETIDILSRRGCFESERCPKRNVYTCREKSIPAARKPLLHTHSGTDLGRRGGSALRRIASNSTPCQEQLRTTRGGFEEPPLRAGGTEDRCCGGDRKQSGDGIYEKESVADRRDDDNQEKKDEAIDEKETGGQKNEEDVMQEFGRRLFDTPAYNIVRSVYSRKWREVIILLYASFFIYNGMRAILQTICEDGGFRAIFFKNDAALAEALRRLVIFLLRILTIVVSPLCLVVHISKIAAKPRIRKISFSKLQAMNRMVAVHRSFSPHYEVQFIQSRPESVFHMSEIMVKRHIHSIWMSIINCLLFTCLLAYLGGVKFCTQKVANAGVCQFLTVTTIRLPLFKDDLHILVLLDCATSLGVLLSINIFKDYYYYENRVAMYCMTLGGEAKEVYQHLRRRWLIVDLYCYFTAGALFVIALTLVSLQKTIIPDPTSPLQAKDLLNWFFWISVLSVVSFLGNSSNRLVKETSLVAYVIAAFITNTVNLRIETIPPETINVFFVVTLFNLVINLLLSQCHCQLHHYRVTSSHTSLSLFLLSLSLILLLPVTVLWTIYHEVVHLAAFVQW